LKPVFAIVLTAVIAACPQAPPTADEDRTAAGDDDATSGDDDDLGDDDTTPVAVRSALYPPDWVPGFTWEGHALPDFSYAGYRASEVGVPDVVGPTISVLDHGADPNGIADSANAFQAAIDEVAGLGGGVVFVDPGLYRLGAPLVIAASGTVLRGADASSSRLWFDSLAGMDDRGHITLSGNLAFDNEIALAADAPADALGVTLADASGVAPGDEVQLGFTITDAFIADHGMTGTWVSFTGQWRAFARRTVVAVDPSSDGVTLDVPLREPLLVRDGASMRRVVGAITEAGVEDLAVSTVNSWASAWEVTRTHAIDVTEAKDVWVRRVESFSAPGSPSSDGDHLASGGIRVLDSRRVTVSECVLAEAQNRGGGGNGYLFEVSRSNEVLFVDDVARAGRHNFIQNWDFGTSGCVFLRTRSEDGRALFADWDPVGTVGYSEYHHSLATANLVDDSFVSDGWQAVNRQDESSGAGHSATRCVFWNLRGGGQLRSLQWASGYVIGTEGLTVTVDPTAPGWNSPGEGTEPADWTEWLEDGDRLEPISLFEAQHARRVGGER
jgi:hypothetical protein